MSSLRLDYNGQTLISSAGNHVFGAHSHPAKDEAINQFSNWSGSTCKCHSAAGGETYSIWQEVVVIPSELTSFFFYLIAGLMISRLPPTHEAMTSNWISFPPLCEQHCWPGISGAELMASTGCNLREDPDAMMLVTGTMPGQLKAPFTLSSVVELLLVCCFFVYLFLYRERVKLNIWVAREMRLTFTSSTWSFYCMIVNKGAVVCVFPYIYIKLYCAWCAFMSGFVFPVSGLESVLLFTSFSALFW